MSPYRLLILLGAIDEFIRIFCFLFNTRKLVQYIHLQLQSLFQFFVKIFYIHYLKWKKKELQRLYSKKLFQKKMNILKIFCY